MASRDKSKQAQTNQEDKPKKQSFWLWLIVGIILGYATFVLLESF